MKVQGICRTYTGYYNIMECQMSKDLFNKPLKSFFLQFISMCVVANKILLPYTKTCLLLFFQYIIKYKIRHINIFNKITH